MYLGSLESSGSPGMMMIWLDKLGAIPYNNHGSKR